MVFIAGLMAGFGSYVFAAEDYNSSRSNTQTSIAKINEEVGNVLLRYGAGGAGGAEINEVTDALAVGISTVDLKAMLIRFGVSDDGITEVFAELDRLGTGDATQGIDSFFDVFVELEVFVEVIANDANLTKTEAGRVIDTLMKISPAFIIDENGLQESRKAELVEAIASDASLTRADAKRALDAFAGAITKSAPALHKALISGERVALVGFGSFSISKRKARTGRVKYSNITLKRGVFKDTAMNAIQNIKSAAPEERENLKEELKVSRGTFQTEILSMSLSIRENAKELRENFRENVKTTIGHVDHGKTARIALAHGKGLRMLNRFRSATARFGHILSRLESRVNKLEAQGIPTDSFFDVFTSIEEAKNTQVENDAKMEQLKAKYESLLEGENVKGVAEEARAIAKELKSEIQTLHAKLRAIKDDIKVAGEYNSSISNSSTDL